jgi:hypothetical protein
MRLQIARHHNDYLGASNFFRRSSKNPIFAAFERGKSVVRLPVVITEVIFERHTGHPASVSFSVHRQPKIDVVANNGGLGSGLIS